MAKNSVRQIYDKLGANYDRWTRVMDSSGINKFRKQLLERASGRVLEVAVGTGKNLQFYPPGCDLTGVDLSPRMLEVANERATQQKLPFTPQIGNVEALTFPNESFDTVVCTLGLCTFPHPEQAVSEMRRVCKPSGQLLFLEHTRPQNPWVAFALDKLERFTIPRLGCHAGRNTLESVRLSGVMVTEEVRRLGGLLFTLQATP